MCVCQLVCPVPSDTLNKGNNFVKPISYSSFTNISYCEPMLILYILCCLNPGHTVIQIHGYNLKYQ